MTNQTYFQVAMFAFNTVLLYDYFYIIAIWYNMCSTWFLDIRISTCSNLKLLLISSLGKTTSMFGRVKF